METRKPRIEKQNDSDCISPSELVHRHLQNKDHQISDEELEKISIDCLETSSLPAEEALPSKTDTPATELKDDVTEENKEDVIVTPLDVIH